MTAPLNIKPAFKYAFWVMAALLFAQPALAIKYSNPYQAYDVIDISEMSAQHVYQYLEPTDTNSPYYHTRDEATPEQTLHEMHDGYQQLLAYQPGEENYDEWQTLKPKLEKLVKKEQELNELLSYFNKLEQASHNRLPPPP